MKCARRVSNFCINLQLLIVAMVWYHLNFHASLDFFLVHPIIWEDTSVFTFPFIIFAWFVRIYYHITVVVFCESCIVAADDGSIKCKVCESTHQGDFPKVCTVFIDLLKEIFPNEYGQRENVVQRDNPSCMFSFLTLFRLLVFANSVVLFTLLMNWQLSF